METKQVTHLLPAELVDMGGFPVKQPLPTLAVEQVDPFLLLHHARVKPIRSRDAKHQGVGPHPHRGFSPVTFVIEGGVHHRDSRGNSQVASEGDVQWMHAGAGIVHSERPSEEMIAGTGHQEIIQLWINTPQANKMIQPDYQYLAKSEMPVITSSDGHILSKLIAGTYNGLTSPIRTQSELLILWGQSKDSGSQILEIPAGFSSALYIIKGSVNIGGYGLVEKESLIVFKDSSNASELKLDAKEGAQFLFLAGKPINEKVVQHGPFVMNSETEIMEAMRDYQMGKMGVLIED